jgi:F-type H+-transporting ATPase subunit c
MRGVAILKERRNNMRALGTLLVVAALCLVAEPAIAADEAAAGGGIVNGLIALAAGLGMGIAAFGVGLGQGRATAAAMESIGRNPNSADKIFTPLVLGLALMEALALYTLVIGFLLQLKF